MSKPKITDTAAAPKPGNGSGLRRFYYFSAAVTGAAILIIEILGAKMLSPYLGTSHFVWTAQISITLVALAAGYYAGGRWVDRAIRPGRLYAAILAAGVYLASISNFAEPIAYKCLDLRLAVGSLLASLILFFVPLFLLAMTGPFLIRVLTVSVITVGGSVGRLSAISTLGSLVGTLLISYAMIPFLRNSISLLLTAAALMLLAGTYFVGWGRRGSSKAATALTILAGLGFGINGVQGDVFNGRQAMELFRGNSSFGRLQVLQINGRPYRAYLNDFLTQNTYDTATQQSMSSFTYLLHGLARAYTTNLDDVLCIGLGVGIVPMELARSGACVDAVEINPAIVPVAERWFDFKPDQVNLFIEDGRCYLNRCSKQYDAVLLDAFVGDAPPSHLMTRETFASIRRVLNPGGTLVINSFGSLESGRDFATASLWNTLRSVFPGVRIHHAPDGNMMFVASMNSPLAMVREPDTTNIHPRCAQEVRDVFASSPEPDAAHGIVLTDEYNPIEFRDLKNREDLRRALALGTREL